MNIHLAVTPTGRIVAIESSPQTNDLADVTPDAGSDPRLEKKIAQQFAASQAEGLFALATERMDRPPNPSFAYWRDFASRYLTELCHTPEITGAGIEAIPAPASADLAAMVWNVPPMQGAEYLTEGVLSEIWTDLDAWVRREVARTLRWLGGVLEGPCRPVAPGGPSLLSSGREPPRSGLPVCVPGNLRTGADGGGTRPVPAAEQSVARVRRRQRQEDAHQAALAGSVGRGEKRIRQGTGRIGRSLPAAGLDAARGLPVPERYPGPRRKRRAGAHARLVEKAAPAPRGRDDRRQETEEVRRQRHAGLPRPTGAGRSGVERSRMARIDGGRTGPGVPQGAMGRSGSRQAGRGTGPLEEGRTGRSRRALICRRHASAGRRPAGSVGRRGR